MYKAFSYSPSSRFYNNYINRYKTIGDELYKSHKEEVQKCLSDYISEDGVIQGSTLKQNWFSIEKTDIFISHSHKDFNKVKAFAGWLKNEFELTTFIDSCSWGYCDDLLRKIDDEYCYNKRKNTYDYNLRNYTTSHVHMMLSTALTEMMDRSECIIFFDTPNSIIMRDELESIRKKKTTTSPWILYELTMVSEMRRVKPDRIISSAEHQEFAKREDFTIEYDVDNLIDTIPSLNDEHLTQLIKRHSGNKHVLDELYEIIG